MKRTLSIIALFFLAMGCSRTSYVNTRVGSSNAAPTLSFTQPADSDDVIAVNGTFNLAFTPADTDDNATVNLYYSSAATNCDSSLTGWTQIVTGLTENTTSTYAWDTTGVAAGNYYICGKIDDGTNSAIFAASSGTLQINAAPTLAITEPAGTNDAVALNASFTVTYTPADSDDNAAVSLYYSTSSANCTNGSLAGWTSFATGLAENSVSSTSWDTNAVAAGNYYICGKIEDATNPAVYALSGSYVKISAVPTIAMTAPASAVVVPQVGTYAITFTPADSDDNADVTLYYKNASSSCNSSLTGWTQIVGSLAENTVSSYNWTTDAVTAGTYYICARISDGVNAAVFAVSAGTLKINAAPTIALTAPTTLQYALQASTLALTWTAGDADDAAVISVYLKTTNSGACTASSTALTTTLNEGTDSGYSWDTTGTTTSGLYYLCIRISDAVNPVVDIYTPGIAVYRVCTWTGATSITWSTAGNWSGCNSGAPTLTDRVLIPSAPTNQPTVTASTTIGGVASGSGGGTVTMVDNVDLSIQAAGDSSMPTYFESSAKFQGATSTCSNCRLALGHVIVRDEATLTLGNGLYYLATYAPIRIGDGTSAGHLQTVADTGNPAEYPAMTNQYNRGFSFTGTSSSKSSLKITGLTLTSRFFGYPFDFQNHYEIMDFNALRLTSTVHSLWLVKVDNCANATFTSTSWTGWVMDAYSLNTSIETTAACSGYGPITVTGSGSHYGSGIEYDAGNIISWTNGARFDCTWTGAVSTDWFAPGNWSGCANGRGGYPDINDNAMILSTPTNQPVISTLLYLRGINSGVAPGTGGTLTVAANAEVTTYYVSGDLKFKGDTPGCTTCILSSRSELWVWGGSVTLELMAGITVSSSNRLLLSNNATLKTDAAALSTDPNEWPLIRAPVENYAAGTKIYLNGVRFYKLATSTDPSLTLWGGSSSSFNFTIEKFDNIIFDTSTTTSNLATTTVLIHPCTGYATFTDTTWSNIDFIDGYTGAGRNITFATCASSLSGGSLSITDRSGGTNAGYGAAYATDANGYMNWQ